MTAPHTAGPWRWELNESTRSLHLVGGRPRYDLSIMYFERWGMNSATVCLRDTAHDGMNIMHKLHDRRDWIAPFPGRDHHARWCADVIHPDMRLMAAAPDLLEALVGLLEAHAIPSTICAERPAYDKARAAIAKAQGTQQ